MKEKIYQLTIIGAGAGGLFCGANIEGVDACIIEKELNPARKLNLTGGGKCNFSNMDISDKNYVCVNKHFVKSALSGFSVDDFLQILKDNNIEVEQRDYGRLFCRQSAMQISNMLVNKCKENKVSFFLGKEVIGLEKQDDVFTIEVKDSNKNITYIKSHNVVIATGGLALNGSKFAIDLAKKLKIETTPKIRPALVCVNTDNSISDLAGISLNVKASFEKNSFYDGLVFTQTGLSGPVIYQISLYADKGDTISIDFLPDVDIAAVFDFNRGKNISIESILSDYLPKRLAKTFVPEGTQSLSNCSKNKLEEIISNIKSAKFRILSLDNYNKAEVMLGGVSSNEVSSKTMESKKVKGLYFIGEALDVTGQLGGYNLHWAWASGFAAAEAM